jgi:hypothetical protein
LFVVLMLRFNAIIYILGPKKKINQNTTVHHHQVPTERNEELEGQKWQHADW